MTTTLLTDVKDAIKARYPKTDVHVDRLVVTVTYSNFHVEIQPVFEKADENGNNFYLYPDTYNGGHWKDTKPRQEMRAVKDLNDQKNGNLRLLCKMVRAWRDKHGVVMGGLLIDTLVYNFMKSTSDFDGKSFLYFDLLSRDFFKYLSEQPDQDYYKAPGSNQNVKVKKRYQNKASEAYDLCIKAIAAEKTGTVNEKWKKLYGRHFPASAALKEMAKTEHTYRDTEEFIEDYYPIDIRYNITVDCSIYQRQGLPRSLLSMLARGFGISNNRKLIFRITEHDIEGDFEVKWKILNRGDEARRRDCIRGKIEQPNDVDSARKETADFRGDHLVECYILKDGFVVARDAIKVPII